MPKNKKLKDLPKDGDAAMFKKFMMGASSDEGTPEQSRRVSYEHDSIQDHKASVESLAKSKITDKANQ